MFLVIFFLSWSAKGGLLFGQSKSVLVYYLWGLYQSFMVYEEYVENNTGLDILQRMENCIRKCLPSPPVLNQFGLIWFIFGILCNGTIWVILGHSWPGCVVLGDVYFIWSYILGQSFGMLTLECEQKTFQCPSFLYTHIYAHLSTQYTAFFSHNPHKSALSRILTFHQKLIFFGNFYVTHHH